MMRELDTVSPVVWPSWCYSGEGQGDSEPGSATSDHHLQQQQQQQQQPQQSSAPATTTSTVATAKPRGKRRAGAATMNGGTNNASNAEHQNNNNNNNPPVKTERLSPTATTTPTASTATTTVSGAGNAASNIPDNNSSSSRSATPSSSYPGTPPGGLPAERGSSPSSSPAGHIKHMEQMMTRNYSDFMRSLAAKYNNANPNDYFSAPTRNGFPVGLDPRFTPFKSGATPFVGLMAPLATTTVPSPGQLKNNSASQNNTTITTSSSTPIVGTTASSKDSILDSNHLKKPSTTSVEAQQALYAAAANFSANPFGTGAATNSPMFPPLIDMSSTQALLSMVRTASAHNASQLETYLKGAIKRPPPSESSPLDLSSAALPAYGKRSRTAKGLSSASENVFLNSDSLLHVPMVDALRTTKERLGKRTGSVSPKPPARNSGVNSAGSSPRLLPSSTVTSAVQQQHVMGRNLPCLSMCSSDRGCGTGGDAQTIAHWSVEDVCGFVSSIDICAEYVPNFREQRIDGSSLPLLTEEHLTNTMGMKLGPALKLRATLSRRLGHCAICMHCVHCHNPPATLAATMVSPAQTPPSVVGRPNSTGN